MSNLMDTLAYLHGKPSATGQLKAKPEHFFVSETLNFTPSGSGEHFLVKLRKTGENTKYVANELAKACGVSSKEVSWAGLKDRHAVTEQWFSVQLAGKPDPDLTAFIQNHPGIDAVLATARHDKKLRPGDLIGNQFKLRVTDITDRAEIEQKLALIAEHGVPNYFGQQRFGRDGNNIVAAREWGQDKFRVKDKSKRSFYLSAARSYLFNLVLSERIKQGLCHKPLSGDILLDAAHQSQLVETEQAGAALLAENSTWRISGPMTGDNALPTQADAQHFEQQILDTEPDLLAVIRANRMRHERRPLLLYPQAMRWDWPQSDCLDVHFFLPAGCFATALMREVIDGMTDGENHAYIDQ